MLRLVKLTPEMESEYLEFTAECDGDKVIPSAASIGDKTFGEYLESLKLAENKETCEERLVPATLYFLVNESGRILGAIHFRHYLNEYLLNFGGHIGYGIRPSERRKGYAKEQLKLMLPIAKSSGLEKVLITCDDDNEGSSKTIVACGGVLENKQMNDNTLTRRYWIEL